ncbi:MAG: FAD-dependent oxidoreductase [Planctomycetes bacterium]|nr:FAD-dependent oxidoreductase [Planctomycetota bacterium]
MIGAMSTAPAPSSHDLVIVGGTPGGICAAIAAARQGLSVLLLERTTHVGGLPANGLGATDIATRALSGGLFRTFVERVKAHYVATYGADSEQVRVCSDGYHFEPSIGEKVLLGMLAEQPRIEVRLRRQFDALAANVERVDGRLSAVRVTDLATGRIETCAGRAFVDATYEGDLAHAAGVPWATRREGTADYHEPRAGRFYQAWGDPAIGDGSTGVGDDTIQAYNYRLCITSDPANRVEIRKPEGYDRAEYASLAEDLRLDRKPGLHRGEAEWDGIGRITNIVWLPNGKTDANNQHLAFISTDLPEENWPWPTADWAWRDRFASRLRNYILGLFWFMQNDPEVPESFRRNAARFGLARDEYADNGHFPRQVYVREGRRILGEHCFIAQDALPTAPGARPPIHPTAITASHYAIDSHAVHKREAGRAHLDGFLSLGTKPYTVPYGVIVPRTVDNLWAPVPVSASHLGFGTLRMEPCWMVLGEAAGAAAALALRFGVAARTVPIERLQRELIAHRAVLIHYPDADRDHPAFPGLQFIGVRGGIPAWEARLEDAATAEDAARWSVLAGLARPVDAGGTRSQVLQRIWAALG